MSLSIYSLYLSMLTQAVTLASVIVLTCITNNSSVMAVTSDNKENKLIIT